MKKKNNIQQQNIADMKKKLDKLEQENQFLKQLISESDGDQRTQDIQARLQQTLAEAVALKMQYEAAVQAILTMKQNYKTEMNSLLTRLRADVKRKKRKST